MPGVFSRRIAAGRISSFPRRRESMSLRRLRQGSGGTFGLRAPRGQAPCPLLRLRSLVPPWPSELSTQTRMCPPSEGTTTALQPLTVAVHLVARHRCLRQRVSGTRPTELREEWLTPG